MTFVRWFVMSIRALLVAGLAVGPTSGQERGIADQEEVEWRSALREGTAVAFERYLERYPTGRHAGEAFACSVEEQLCSKKEVLPSGGPFVADTPAGVY